MAAPTAPDPEAALKERGEMVREFSRRMLTPLAELIEQLREGGA